MKLNIGAYLMILAGVMMSFAACGGGNNSSPPVVMTSLNNPVLVNYSTTVYANFSNYTSSVRFGSPITFTVSPDVASFSHVTPNSATFSHFSTITSRVVKTDVGGMAWVMLKSPLPGRFIVKATSIGSTVLEGQTSVSFIVQPAAIEVRVGLRNALTNVGRLDFDLVSSLPAPVFDNFSGIQSPLLLAEDTTPLLPGIPDGGVTNLHVTSMQGISLKALLPQFLFHYVPIEPSAPSFTLANISCKAADTNGTPLSANLFIVSTKYFDSAGNELFH